MKNSITFKLFLIGVLVLVLLIPSLMITFLIYEREATRNNAVSEISSKWGGVQNIGGPVLTVPYKQYVKESYREDNKDKERVVKVIRYAHFLPDEIRIDGDVFPQIRYRGIYEAVLYNTKLRFEGFFSFPDFETWDIPVEDVIWKDAFVSVGVPRHARDQTEYRAEME